MVGIRVDHLGKVSSRPTAWPGKCSRFEITRETPRAELPNAPVWQSLPPPRRAHGCGREACHLCREGCGGEYVSTKFAARPRMTLELRLNGCLPVRLKVGGPHGHAQLRRHRGKYWRSLSRIPACNRGDVRRRDLARYTHPWWSSRRRSPGQRRPAAEEARRRSARQAGTCTARGGPKSKLWAGARPQQTAILSSEPRLGR
jgi:hypothetical protein